MILFQKNQSFGLQKQLHLRLFVSNLVVLMEREEKKNKIYD